MSLDSLCTTHSITVERPTITVDSSAGTRRENWISVTGLTGLPCSKQPLSGREKLVFAQKQLLMTDKFYLAGDYTSLIQRSDRVKDDTSGSVYRLQSVSDVGGKGRLTMLEAFEYLP